MLKDIHSIFGALFLRRTLLLTTSLITFQSFVFAATKQETAEEYRVKAYEEHQKGNLGEALSYYSKAISLGLENPTVLNDLGVLYEQMGLPARAESYYLQAVKIDKGYLPAYTNLGYLYLSTGNPASALKYFKIRFEQAESDDPWKEKITEEILKLEPEFRQVLIQDEANALHKEIVAKNRQDFYDKVLSAQAHYKKGLTLFKEKKYTQAIDAYDQALSLMPQNPKILKARDKARLELAKKRFQGHSDQVLKMLDAGDTYSAKKEAQKMLTTIPEKPILVSE